MLKNMQLFVEVAKAKSFRRAGEHLGIPNATVSRRIAELEKDVGLRLFTRTTRQVDLTDAGRTYFEDCERIIEDAQLAHQALMDIHTKPKGLIRISMPVDFSNVFLSKLLVDFSLKYPEIHFDLDLTPASANVVGDDVDVAIRMRQPTEQNVIAKKIATMGAELYASPTYLKIKGTPRTPKDLLKHTCLRMRNGPWVLQRIDGSKQVDIPVVGQYVVNNVGYLRNLALLDQGIFFTAEKMIAAELKSRALVRVLPNWAMQDVSIYLLTGTRLLPSKVRMLVDYLTKHLQVAVSG